MSEDLEDLLRAEFAGRAESAPLAYDEHLADTAITGARRMRRRRRVGAAVAGGGLAVLVAAAFVWTPSVLDRVLNQNEPIASTYQEAQDDLAIEFVVENDGAWGVVDTSGKIVDIPVEEEPNYVHAVSEGYLVEEFSHVRYAAEDGGEVAELAILEDSILDVRSDGEAFSIEQLEGSEPDQVYVDLYRADAAGMSEPRSLEFSYDLALATWSDSTLVLYAGLTSVTGGGAGSYNFNEEFDYGLEAAGEAGFESVVLADWDDSDYVCVSDLEPGVAAAPQEYCGYLYDSAVEDEIQIASADPDALETLTVGAAWAYDDEGPVTLTDEDYGEYEEQIQSREFVYYDPLGRWEIAYDSGSPTWTMVQYTDEEAIFSEFTPPDGAVMPVMSYG